MKKPFNIPSFKESLRRDVETGKITIEEAAVELCEGGYTNYVSVEKTIKILLTDKA